MKSLAELAATEPANPKMRWEHWWDNFFCLPASLSKAERAKFWQLVSYAVAHDPVYDLSKNEYEDEDEMFVVVRHFCAMRRRFGLNEDKA